MLDRFFSPLHLLVLIFIPVLIVIPPLLLIYLLARWFDRRSESNVKISVLAVAIGGISDVVLSTLLAIPVIIYVMIKYDLLHAPHGAAAIASTIGSSAWLYGLQLIVGMAGSVLGGYIAARLAKHNELLNGLLSSFLCITIGVYSALSGKNSHPILWQTFLLISAPALALLGGYLSQKRKQSAIARA